MLGIPSQQFSLQQCLCRHFKKENCKQSPRRRKKIDVGTPNTFMRIGPNTDLRYAHITTTKTYIPISNMRMSQEYEPTLDFLVFVCV